MPSFIPNPRALGTTHIMGSWMAHWEDDDTTSFEVGSSKNKKKKQCNGQA